MSEAEFPKYPAQMASTPMDFPCDDSGSVTGSQPKFSARLENGKYVSGPNKRELYARYEKCFDLVNQLQDYCGRKLAEHPAWTTDELLRKLSVGVSRRSDWDCTPGERRWLLEQLCVRMHWVAPANLWDAVKHKSMCTVLTFMDQKSIDRLLGLKYTEDGKLAPPETVVETMVDQVRKRLQHPVTQRN